MIRLAIHPEDIKAFNLPPQRIKPTDSRAAKFKRRFGAKAPTAELDALPVTVLRQRIREAIEDQIGFELWERQVAIHEVELQCIADFANRVKSLPQCRRRKGLFRSSADKKPSPRSKSNCARLAAYWHCLHNIIAAAMLRIAEGREPAAYDARRPVLEELVDPPAAPRFIA
jgi:hypothetical protein